VTTDAIKLGTISGPNATVGIRAARVLAPASMSTLGGNGRKMELIVEDDGFDPNRTRLAVEKLITQDHVFAIVSPLGTITNLAVMDYLIEQQIPVISPHSGVSMWSTPLKRTYFALQPSYRIEGQLLAQYALDELAPKRTIAPARSAGVGIFAVDDQFGREGSTAFVQRLAVAGMQPAATVMHLARESAPDKWVAALATCQPDLVLLTPMSNRRRISCARLMRRTFIQRGWAAIPSPGQTCSDSPAWRRRMACERPATRPGRAIIAARRFSVV
jgi:ABC-type branched-subunit amino acid transport system substrate-binding protein